MNNYEDIDERTVEDALCGILAGDCDAGDTALEDCRVRTYGQAGLLTGNSGLLITLPDGSEFQITIVRSR